MTKSCSLSHDDQIFFTCTINSDVHVDETEVVSGLDSGASGLGSSHSGDLHIAFRITVSLREYTQGTR